MDDLYRRSFLRSFLPFFHHKLIFLLFLIYLHVIKKMGLFEDEMVKEKGLSNIPLCFMLIDASMGILILITSTKEGIGCNGIWMPSMIILGRGIIDYIFSSPYLGVIFCKQSLSAGGIHYIHQRNRISHSPHFGNSH